MSDDSVPYRLYELPWTVGRQERWARRILLLGLAVSGIASAVVANLPVPPPDTRAPIEVPRRVARFLLDRPPSAPTPEPPTPAVLPDVAVPPPPPEEKVAEVIAPPPAEPAAVPTAPDLAEQARARANAAGLLPFANDLAALRDKAALDVLTGAQMTGAVEGPAASERALLTSRVGASSGGINTAALSRSTGGGALATRSITDVGDIVAGTSVAESNQSKSRTREEIEQVFDRNLGAIHALYNRALRANPALRGRVVVRLSIAPTGKVLTCEIVSSELGDAELEQKLVQRVLLFEFEPRDVETITTTKPLEFQPS